MWNPIKCKALQKEVTTMVLVTGYNIAVSRMNAENDCRLARGLRPLYTARDYDQLMNKYLEDVMKGSTLNLSVIGTALPKDPITPGGDVVVGNSD